jgi:hypothetical protein
MICYHCWSPLMDGLKWYHRALIPLFGKEGRACLPVGGGRFYQHYFKIPFTPFSKGK